MYTYLKKLAEGAPPKLGPVERWLDSGARGLLGANSAAYKHYTANRNLWNIALPAIGVGATTLMTNAAQNAFSGGNNRQGGGSSPWSWLLPLGLIGGGLWAWNKYGDRIMGAAKDYEQVGQKTNVAMDAVNNRIIPGVTAIVEGGKRFVGGLNKKLEQTDLNKLAQIHGDAAGRAALDAGVKRAVPAAKRVLDVAGSVINPVGYWGEKLVGQAFK